MTDLSQLIQSGSGHILLYLPVAVLLGALHGLEPGHSKTMMAAFIIAIRGTIAQAVLLGLSAAFSHSLIIWLLASVALLYGSHWDAEAVEPYLQIVSGLLILLLAAWMFRRTAHEVAEAHAHAEAHGKPLPSPSGLHEMELPMGLQAPARLAARAGRGPNGGMLLDTGHGWLEITARQAAGAPRLRIYPCRAGGLPAPPPRNTTMAVETTRLDGSTQRFHFEVVDGFWESTAVLPEPHEFTAVVTMAHDGHAHSYRLRFHEDAALPAAIAEQEEEVAEDYQDAHERAHAEDIARRFANRTVTTWQIVLFGVTGGLMPCPAAFSILLVCLQLKRVTLGFAIVGAFSFGLALTMVSVGALAAWSLKHAERRFGGFGDALRKAPYLSSALLVVLSVAMIYSGWRSLHF